jgi:selenocysteine-specific elongation factor
VIAGVKPLRHGARVRFHQGTTEVLGRVAVAAPRGGEGSTAEIAPGGSSFTRIRLETRAALTRGDRFVLRAYSPPVTIGGGVVLDPHPPRSAIRTPAGVARLRRIDAAVPIEEAVMAFVDERGAAALERRALIARAGLTARAAAAVADRLSASGRVTPVGESLVSSAVVESLSRQLMTALESHHKTQPLSEGLPREEARERLFGKAAPVVFDHVLASLSAAGRIVARDRLALSQHQVSLSPEEAAASVGLVRVFLEAGLAPPDLAAAAALAHVPVELADRVAKLLVRQKTLVKLDVLLFHAEALSTLKAEVRALKGGAGARVDVAAFKERYGITRKYAIPLLEYLDRERVTRRVGDARVVL